MGEWGFTWDDKILTFSIVLNYNLPYADAGISNMGGLQPWLDNASY